jgi:ribosomal protein L12E/L44/L45/RPP1/RPP2
MLVTLIQWEKTDTIEEKKILDVSKEVGLKVNPEKIKLSMC